MTLKRTDLDRRLGLKIENQRKGRSVPARFGKASTMPAGAATATATAGANNTKPIAVTCRLPADVVAALRAAAPSHKGGIHGLMTDAARQWLAAAAQPQQAQPQAVSPAEKTTKKASKTTAKKASS